VDADADDEEERVCGGEVVDAACEVPMMAGDGLIEEARLEGGEFLDPLHEEEVAGERRAFGWIFDGRDGGPDDGGNALLPHGVDGEFAGIEMMCAGIAAGALLAGGRAGTARLAAVGATGGYFLIRDANE